MWSKTALVATSALVLLATNLAVFIGLFWSSNARVAEDVIELRREVRSMAQQAKQAKARRTELAGRTKEMNAALAELGARLDGVNTLIQSMNESEREHLAEVEKQVAELRKGYDTHVSSHDGAINDLSQQIEKLKSLERQIQENRQALDALSAKLNAAP